MLSFILILFYFISPNNHIYIYIYNIVVHVFQFQFQFQFQSIFIFYNLLYILFSSPSVVLVIKVHFARLILSITIYNIRTVHTLSLLFFFCLLPSYNHCLVSHLIISHFCHASFFHTIFIVLIIFVIEFVNLLILLV
ncbi:MAG: hypothetical protein ACI8RD_003176 [Bacillariaceae sp.]|jgi:hypothetical protein